MRPRRAWRVAAARAAAFAAARAGGFFLPHRHAREPAAQAAAAAGYPAVAELFARAEPAFLDLLGEAGRHAAALAAFRGPAPEPRLDQDWFPRLDAAAAYALVRSRRPRRVVEVGSGHSTRVIARAVRDGGLPTGIFCVDPAPRAPLAGLPVRHLPALLQAADPAALLDGFGPGDVLFVDSSHVAMPGTDVELVFTALLPRLPAGALLHLHDVFLPDPYPAAWGWRGYNEQGWAASLLLAGRLEPLWASRYVATRLAAEVAASPLAGLPLVPGAVESSLWATVR